MKMGVLYVRPGQTSPTEWFQNGINGDCLHPDFWNFMNTLGDTIDLSEWSGYRGDMGAEGSTYYTKWDNQIDCIFHVSSLMNAEGHRRLIGILHALPVLTHFR